MNIVCKYRYSGCQLCGGECEYDYDVRECKYYKEKDKTPDRLSEDGTRIIMIYDPDCIYRSNETEYFGKNYKTFDYQSNFGLILGKKVIQDGDIDYLQIGNEVVKEGNAKE